MCQNARLLMAREEGQLSSWVRRRYGGRHIALGRIAFGSLHEAGEGAHQDDAAQDQANDDHGSFHSHSGDQLGADGSQEGGGAAVAGHAEAAGKTALIGKPADGGVGGRGVAEADAHAEKRTVSNVQQTGTGGGHQSRAHKSQSDEDAAQGGGQLCADLGEQDAAEEVTDHGESAHHGCGTGNGFGLPALIASQRGNKNGCRVDDTSREHDDQTTDQDTSTV